MKTKVYVVNLENKNESKAVEKTEVQPIRLYKERYLVATVVCLQQILSSILWVSYPSVANVATSYYNVSYEAINWLTDVSYVTYVVFIIPTMWLLHKYDIAIVSYVTGIIGIVGSVIRLFGNYNFVPQQYRFIITMLGQTIGSITFATVMVLPTQVSQSWFPENHRVIATAITTMNTYVGSVIGVLVAPYLAPTPSTLYYMNDVLCGTCIVLGFTAFFIIHSKPPTPPYVVDVNKSEETLKETTSFIHDLKIILKDKDAMILAFVGGGIGASTTSIYTTLLQQMFCPAGYSNVFVGICGAITFGAGVILSPFIAYISGRTKLLDEAVKVTLALTLICSIILILIVRIPNIELPIAIICFLIGIFSLSAIPLCMELGVEICYPVNEGMSGTMFWIFSQIQTAILTPLIALYGQPLNKRQMKIESCTVGDSAEAFDLTYPLLVQAAIFVAEIMVLFIWCHPKYNRMEAENAIRAKNEENASSKIINQLNFINDVSPPLPIENYLQG